MEGFTQRRFRAGHFLLGALLLAIVIGCQPAEEDPSADVQQTSGQQLSNRSADDSPAPSATAQLQVPAGPPVPREYVPGPGPAPYEPHVVFTSGMQTLNPVGVGDAAPAFTLPTHDGSEATLAELMGQKLTLLVFWRSDEVFCVEEIARLERDVLAEYSGLGLEVVTVHVGEPTAKTEEILAAVQPRFAVLVDAEETVVPQYAAALFPRTYLLDAQGNILWFDLEYSRSTRRQMDNAIRYYLLDSQ